MVSRIIQYTDGSVHEPLSSKTTFCTVHGNIYNDVRYIYGNQTRSLEVGKEYNPDDSDKCISGVCAAPDIAIKAL